MLLFPSTQSGPGSPGIRPDLLYSHPRVPFPAFKHTFDNLHVVHSIRKRSWHRRIVQNGERELIGLERVLVAGVERNFVDLFAR